MLKGNLLPPRDLLFHFARPDHFQSNHVSSSTQEVVEAHRHVQQCLIVGGRFGRFWSLLDPSGSFWKVLDAFGPFWPLLGTSGPFWTNPSWTPFLYFSGHFTGHFSLQDLADSSGTFPGTLPGPWGPFWGAFLGVLSWGPLWGRFRDLCGPVGDPSGESHIGALLRPLGPFTHDDVCLGQQCGKGRQPSDVALSWSPKRQCLILMTTRHLWCGEVARVLWWGPALALQIG